MAKPLPLPRGEVPLDPASAALLGRFAMQLGRAASATIAPGPIEEAEAAFHTAIPYEVLAVLAIEERSLHTVFEITDEARRYYDATERGLAHDLGLDKVVNGDWKQTSRFLTDAGATALDAIEPALAARGQDPDEQHAPRFTRVGKVL